MTGKESLAKAAAPAAVSKGNNEHSHLDLVAVRRGELLQIPSDVSGRARAVQGDWQHVRRARARVPKSDMGQVGKMPLP